MTEPSENTEQTAKNQGAAEDFQSETIGNFEGETAQPVVEQADVVAPEVEQPEAAREFSEDEIAHIESIAVPGVVRKAPRISVFFWLGSLVGIIAGLIIGFVLTQPQAPNRWIEITVTVAFTTMVTVMIAGALFLFLDRRSVKEAHGKG